jgi:hypothetical protein
MASKLQRVIQRSELAANISRVQAGIDNSPRQSAQRRAMGVAQLQPVGININDDPGLENEADVLGTRAAHLGRNLTTGQLKTESDSARETVNQGGLDKVSGFPLELKAGFAAMGYEINPRVHYGSSRPAQLNALAYAQGNDIYVGPGQERHLPHEAAHIVQQSQGRVLPTRQLYSPLLRGSEHPYQVPDRTAYSGQDDMVTTVMSNDAYAEWSQSIQCKLGMHGACTVGGQTFVTQFSHPTDVLQRFPLSNKVKGFLVLAEGLLTLGAGIAAIALTGGVGAIPGIITAAVGIVKIVRGCFMMKDNPNKPVVDALRMLEAAAATAGGIITGNPALLVFAIAKAVRALLMALSDWMGPNTAHPKIKSALDKIASFAHIVEVVALGFSSVSAVGSASDAFDVAGGVAVGGVALSKGVRAADQTRNALSSASAGTTTGTGWTAPDAGLIRTEPAYVD